jgi:type I restriction enzyme S subunit
MTWRSVRLGEIATMKYGKLPPKETSDHEGFPIFTGYRISGYCSEYLYDEPEVIVVARGVGGTGDVKMSPEKSWVTNLAIVLIVWHHPGSPDTGLSLV